MGKGKPRHNNENQAKKGCNRWSYNGKKCAYFDGDGITTFDKECMEPWSYNCRDGNIHNCIKLKLKWLASLSEKERQKEVEKRPYLVKEYKN